ncbi:hypothetical protein RDWZM_004047 [Blomia tropicalis]|uniref:Uncharacterized protein n=1 Tax=Blomia tropicalis TaxID=40697 RepID=A0A9Q0MGX8_BLOTA|nr:WD repeat domain phosphoinositide-interacting protein 4 [Blomia tropicalis]KAJ6225502.1 hypothetical protein RDWZM_004047 [Blomia tropicalis]
MSYGKEVISVSINDDGNMFAACTESGLRVYNMEPLVSKLNIDSSIIGTLGICKLLHRTNLMAIVGGGNRPKYADNTILIWDDDQKRFVLEYTFASRVLSLKLRRDRLFVAERNRITCYTFPGDPAPEKIFTIETGDNPNGMCEVTPCTSATELQLLAYPGHRTGSVQLLDLSTTTATTFGGGSVSSIVDPTINNKSSSTPSLISNTVTSGASVSISPTSVSAHKSEIACIALNRTGTLLATASRKGTLIRIFRITDENSLRGTGTYIPLSPEKVDEFRRGMDTAIVYCIVFSPDNEYVLASSDKGTVHIFALNETRLNRRSTFATVPLVNLNGSYSVNKFTLPAECACVCSFGPDRQSVYAICVDGTFHKYILGKDGNPCERDNFDKYLEAPDEADYIFM